MHDLIFAVAFIAMVATPAMVAAIGGRKEYNPDPESPSMRRANALKIRPVAPIVRPVSIQKAAPVHHSIFPSAHAVFTDGPTLPLHNSRGMANR
jgi:hypothetical protein